MPKSVVAMASSFKSMHTNLSGEESYVFTSDACFHGLELIKTLVKLMSS
jgi:hypothetical protein